MLACERGLIRSLYVQGASIFTSGYRQRIQLPHQEQVIAILFEYLKVHKGPAFVVLPDIPIKVSDTVFGKLQRELSSTWQSKYTAASKAVKRVQLWRNQPQQQLNFG